MITVPLFLFPFPLFLPLILPSPSVSVHLYVAFSALARVLLFPWLVLGQLPHSSILALVHPPPPSSPSSSSSHFCMCAKVWGARHSVQPSGLKVNTYVIANCLQSLGAALKKDMLRRQLRPLAFASLSDCICFKGLVRFIFNPKAFCAPWTTEETQKGYNFWSSPT